MEGGTRLFSCQEYQMSIRVIVKKNPDVLISHPRRPCCRSTLGRRENLQEEILLQLDGILAESSPTNLWKWRHGVNLVFVATLATCAHSLEPALLPQAPVVSTTIHPTAQERTPWLLAMPGSTCPCPNLNRHASSQTPRLAWCWPGTCGNHDVNRNLFRTCGTIRLDTSGATHMDVRTVVTVTRSAASNGWIILWVNLSAPATNGPRNKFVVVHLRTHSESGQDPDATPRRPGLHANRMLASTHTICHRGWHNSNYNFSLC